MSELAQKASGVVVGHTIQVPNPTKVNPNKFCLFKSSAVITALNVLFSALFSI